MKIFVVEDNEWYNKLLVHNISLNPDLEVETFFNGKDLLKSLDKNPDMITLDYRLPDIKGDVLLKKIKEYSKAIQVVVISEQDEIETAIDLLQKGAYDYIVKTKEISARLHNCINKVQENIGLVDRIDELENEVLKSNKVDKSLVGESEALNSVNHKISKAIGNNIPVSIYGETGTGKELVAKAIHFNSKNKKEPFIAVNMSAIPKELIESELFGYEKGAFTGANTSKAGKFEAAGNGTIFLDEIGDADGYVQAKLLRVLQEKEVTRIGSNKSIEVSCRIISATNKNLLEEVKKGDFREDLYYRIHGLPIVIPPLRERGNDIVLLAQHFAQTFCKSNSIDPKKLSDSAVAKIMTHSWPGNVRELKSVIELSVVMSEEGEINANDISIYSDASQNPAISEDLSLREYNYNLVKQLMERYNNKTKKVAEHLKIGQTTVYRILKGE